MSEDEYQTLVNQHLALMNDQTQLLTALVVLVIVALVAMVVIAGLAAWSVQTANRETRVQSEAVRTGIAEVKSIVVLLAQSIASSREHHAESDAL